MLHLAESTLVLIARKPVETSPLDVILGPSRSHFAASNYHIVVSTDRASQTFSGELQSIYHSCMQLSPNVECHSFKSHPILNCISILTFDIYLVDMLGV